MKHAITVTEKLQKTFVIEAGIVDDAVKMVEEAYQNGDVVLTDRDYVGADVQESPCYTREQAEAMETTDTSGWCFQFESCRAWEVLQKINERFAVQDPEDQVVDILNDFPELKLSLGEINDVFIKTIEGAGHSCTYSIPCEQVSRGQRPGPSYFVVASQACLAAENEAMFAAEAAMM